MADRADAVVFYAVKGAGSGIVKAVCSSCHAVPVCGAAPPLFFVSVDFK